MRISLFIVAFAVSSLAQEAAPLFQQLRLEDPAEPTRTEKWIRRTRTVGLDWNLIGPTAAGSFRTGRSGPRRFRTATLNLFPDAVFTARIEPAEGGTDTTSDATAWTGAIENMPLSEVVIAVSGDIASANINTGDGRRFFLRYVAPGIHQVQEADMTAFPPEAQPRIGFVPDAPRSASRAAEDGSIVDVLVAYTNRALSAAGGEAAIKNLIALAATETNLGYANSGVVQRIRVVRTAEVSYNEADFSAALDHLTNSADGQMDEVHTLRNSVNADLTSLWINNTEFCGVAWLMQSQSASFERLAFSVVHYGCATGSYTFAHELGHLQGADHNRANSSGGGVFPYSHGYRQVATSPRFRTIMAYECTDAACGRINYWSNPAVRYQGLPTGIAPPAPDSTDNASTLNNTRVTAANFRAAPNPTLISPSSASFPGTGGTGTITVTSSGGWTAIASQPWVTITSGASGIGAGGTVAYSVAASPFTYPRSATIDINGLSFSITQAASAECAVSPISFGPEISGTLQSTDCRSIARGPSYYADRFTLTAAAGTPVALLASSPAFSPYLYLYGPSGELTAEGDNSGSSGNVQIPRARGSVILPSSGTYTIEITSAAGLASGNYTLRMVASSNCDFAFDPGTIDAPAAGGVFTASIRTLPQCPWSVATNSEWIAITTPRSGTGPGSVTIRVPPNPLASERTAIVWSGNGSLEVRQAGAVACNPSPIRLGETRGGSWTSQSCISIQRGAAYRANRYSFFAQAGQALNLRAIARGVPQATPYLYLFGPDSKLVLANDGAGSGATARIPATPGVFAAPLTGIYIVEVTTLAANAFGEYSLALLRTSDNNDALSGIVPLPVPSRYSQQVDTAFGGPDDPSLSCTGPHNFHTVWFVTTAPMNGFLRARTDGSRYDTAIAAYPGSSISRASELACNDNVASASSTSEIVFPVTAGQNYILVVASTGSSPLGNDYWLEISLEPVYASCSYTVAGTGAAPPPTGAIIPFNVQAPPGCPWQATTLESWISLQGAFGSGPGSLTVRVEPNVTGYQRAGAVRIAGQLFEFLQEAGSECPLAVSKNEIGLPAAESAESITVTAPPGCGWSSSTSASWLSATATTAGGTGALNIKAQANAGPIRKGTVSVAGQTITVTQSGVGFAILAPPAGQLISVNGVTFQWSRSPGATGYSLQIQRSGSIVFQGNLSGADSTSTLVSLAAGNYVFSVRDCSFGFGVADCGGFVSTPFTVAPTAPTIAPSISSPATGTNITSSTQQFSWTAVAGAVSYELQLLDVTTGNIELSTAIFGNGGPPAANTIFTMRPSTLYRLQVRACIAACGPWSAPSNFAVTLPAVPSAAPDRPTCGVTAGNRVSCSWNAVPRADYYIIQLIQSGAGPGGGALTVASLQLAETAVTEPNPLLVPAGPSAAIVAGCNGGGCGPYSSATPVAVPGPSPAAPSLGNPVTRTSIVGPDVFFSWNRVPSDTGNTTYRLYVQDFSRGAAALDVYTMSNFYAAKFRADGSRYDAVVVANPDAASQAIGPPAAFVVRGASPESPTMVQPAHQAAGVSRSIRQGNIQLGWTPVPGATLYEYFVAVNGQSQPVANGVTPGLIVQVPLSVVGGAETGFTGIVRACPAGSACALGSDAGWGPWSNGPGQGGVTNFRLAP